MSALTTTVLKALGVFGGVQGLNILAGIVRSKCAALLLGPGGVGVMSLFVQALMTMSYLTQLSLRQSAVRDLSLLSGTPTGSKARRMSFTARRLGLWLGIAGMVLTFCGAPLLSRWTFGNGDYTAAFMVLSIVPLVTSLTAADNAIMQSFGHLRRLATANVWGSVAGTAALVGSIWFFRTNGIVGAVLSIPIGAWLFSRLYSRGIPGAPAPAPTWRESLSEGKGMLLLGAFLTVSDVVTQLASYVFSIFLSRRGSVADVGIYQSGFTMVNYYVGVIFTAISMEYYPRLTSQARHRSRTSVLVSHEISVALWVLMPVAVFFVCFDELMVRVLYSSAFLQMLPFISLAIGGVVFRAVSWCMAFVMLAKGDGRAFVVTEILSAAIMLGLYTSGWELLGFKGLGIAYIVWYGVYSAVVYGVFRLRYGMRFGRGLAGLIAFAACVCIGASLLRPLIGPVATGALILPWLVPLSLRRLGLTKRR